MKIDAGKNYVALLAIAVYGLMLLPYDNEVSISALLFVSLFLFSFTFEVAKAYIIISLSALFWLYPLLFGIDDWGAENGIRATIPILLIVFVAAFKFRDLDSNFITLFLLMTSCIVARYLTLIIYEVLSEQQSFQNLFSGSTRALINEPILVGYYLFGLWTIFFPKYSNQLGAIRVLIKTIAIFILLIATIFQVRFFIAAFSVIALFRGGWFLKTFVLVVFVSVFSKLPKFNEVSLNNGKFEQFQEVVKQVGENWFFGLGLGAFREDFFLGPVRFTDTAPPLIFLYGGLLGLIWYTGIFMHMLYKYRVTSLTLSLVLLLPLIHSQLVQSGFKMFGMIALPFYFLIQVKLSSRKDA